MKNIYLVGFMGTGKTTVGKFLAERIKKKFVEMDEEIEKKEGKKIVDIFKEKGEPYFRKLEKELLKELAKQSDLVVSCGGGLICDEENLEILKKSGLVINLLASPETIYERTRHSLDRPLLNVSKPLDRIKELLKKRRPFYRQAHYSIKTDTITADEVVEKIIKILKKYYPDGC
ncbi:MAG: shikimate kinase [Candidatus Omnitrophica bacterium]|nr:shikimate kinase [Candidatus Omnitrophota bacterium]